jgi:hypothetical protein
MALVASLPSLGNHGVPAASSSTQWASFDNTESGMGNRERDVVSNDWLGEALEGEGADLFGGNTSL